MSANDRVDPDAILKIIDEDSRRERSGKLRVFLGMAAGVGKTFAMLRAAQEKLKEGVDVVVGVVETHGRQETALLLGGLKIIPRKQSEYRGTQLNEMDLDAILQLQPDLVIVDELAHTNIPGSRHEKRYQDVVELLDAGIDVYTAINVQHLESRKDAVEAITGIPIRETVPDTILERAVQIELVDIAPTELLKRLREGKVYLGERAESAAQNFFKEDRLTALREIALRLTAERVDQDLQRFASIRQGTLPWQTNERLMVAVSHSPFSERLIRATRRLAYNLEAPWIAVYVDSGLELSHSDQSQLSDNLKLARELKAEVITTTDTDVPSALRRIARQKNVTQVIVGRPARRFLADFLEGGTLLDRLVRQGTEFDVHVIRQEAGQFASANWWGELSRLRVHSGPGQYWNVFWILLMMTGFCTLAESVLGYRTVGFMYLLAVLIVGILSSLGPVFFAALLSALAWDYLFIPPKFRFIVSEPDDAILLLSYFVVALIVGFLTNRIKLHERLIRQREERTNVLYDILQDIANSRAKSEFLPKVTARVGKILNAECGILLKGLQTDSLVNERSPFSVELSEKEFAVATWSLKSQKNAGWSTNTLAQSESLYIPLQGQTEKVGVFVFKPKANQNLSLEDENLLFSITRQLGLSIERYFIEKRLLEAQRLKQSEELHQTLLNSISHEMRTPLTSILGAASALEDEKMAGDKKYVMTVAADLHDAGDRLNRVIENLLDMSRLNSGALALNLEWHDFKDLLGVTVQKLAKPLANHRIKTVYPEEVPLLRMDFRLMEHAISNLILNAAIYSPAGTEITITLRRLKDSFRLLVEDEGPGIPQDALLQVFHKFYRVPGTPTGGTGLGLSIVKSIVELHHGSVHAERRNGFGSRFVVELPAETPPQMPSEV